MSLAGINYKLADTIFGTAQKLLYIFHHQAWSGNEYITNKEFFLNLFCNLNSGRSSVPGSFCFS